MQTPLIVAIISAVVSILAAVITIRGQRQTARMNAEMQRAEKAEERRLESEKAVSKYREPLATAAYDLQSRLYNFLEGDLIEKYLVNGDSREQTYIVHNTVFVVAQYFAWTEIIRQKIQYIDLGDDKKTQQLAKLQDDIHSLWRTDTKFKNKLLRIWAGEQRALGESLIVEGPGGPECMGYGKFLETLKTSPPVLVQELESQIQRLNQLTPQQRPRLVALQHALIDLLFFLDPKYIRYPENRRTKVK